MNSQRSACCRKASEVRSSRPVKGFHPEAGRQPVFPGRASGGDCARVSWSTHRQPHRLGEAGPRQDHHKFFTPVAAGNIELADIVLQENRHPAQHFVPELMAVSVVEAFKMVQIQHDKAGREAGAPGALHLLFQRDHQIPPVKQPGEGVGLGKLLQPLAFFLKKPVFFP